MSVDENFWVQDPCILLTNIKLFPTSDMTRDEKLNTLTRLALLAAAGLYFWQYEYWFTFLIIALLVVVLMKYAGKKEGYGIKSEGTTEKTTLTPGGQTPIDLKEEFTLTPTYASPDLHTTTLAPLFSEEWSVYPPAYDIYVNTPPDLSFAEPLNPQSYPYGQYLTRTNLLPSDEMASHLLNGGQRQAREYANSAFLRHTLAHRENMTRLYKKRLARRFRNSCADSFSPFSSY